jgi:hypothetical protein
MVNLLIEGGCGPGWFKEAQASGSWLFERVANLV